MAMSKEDQRKAAERILEKSPLTEEEREHYEFLKREPGTYVVPDEKGRTCGRCGARFKDDVDAKGVVVRSALEKFSDHQAEHNPSPERWTEAHKRFQEMKEQAKGM